MKAFALFKAVLGTIALMIVLIATVAQADPPATRRCKGCASGPRGEVIPLDFECPGTQQCCYTIDSLNQPRPDCSAECSAMVGKHYLEDERISCKRAETLVPGE